MTNLRSVFFRGGRHLLIHTLKAFRPVKLPVKIGVPKTSKCFVLHFLSLPAPLRRGLLLTEGQDAFLLIGSDSRRPLPIRGKEILKVILENFVLHRRMKGGDSICLRKGMIRRHPPRAWLRQTRPQAATGNRSGTDHDL